MIHHLEDIRFPIEQEFRSFEKAFEQKLTSENAQLNEVLAYIHLRRGKQLRPQLVLLAAALCHGVTEKSIQTALALELLHTSTLIHDDVVDDSPTRRGAAAVHTRWSNKVAVLVGDYMLAQVIRIVADLRNTRILNIVAEMGQSLSSGELLQLHSGQSMWISEERYYRIIEQKTARLFKACTEAGAESCAASQRQVRALSDFGLYLGMCFQIKDDILDYSDSEELGKPTMNDIRDGKATLPLLISLSRAAREEAEQIRSLCEALASNSPSIDIAEAEQTIRSFVLRYDGIRYAYKIIENYREKAIQSLSIFRDNPESTSTTQAARESLIAILDYAISRQK